MMDTVMFQKSHSCPTLADKRVDMTPANESYLTSFVSWLGRVGLFEYEIGDYFSIDTTATFSIYRDALVYSMVFYLLTMKPPDTRTSAYLHSFVTHVTLLRYVMSL